MLISLKTLQFSPLTLSKSWSLRINCNKSKFLPSHLSPSSSLFLEIKIFLFDDSNFLLTLSDELKSWNLIAISATKVSFFLLIHLLLLFSVKLIILFFEIIEYYDWALTNNNCYYVRTKDNSVICRMEEVEGQRGYIWEFNLGFSWLGLHRLLDVSRNFDRIIIVTFFYLPEKEVL